MKISVKRSHGRLTIKLSGVLADRHTGELKAAFNEFFTEAQSIVVDLRAVTDLDPSILQLFGAEHRRAVDSGKQFELHVNCSRPLKQTNSSTEVVSDRGKMLISQN